MRVAGILGYCTLLLLLIWSCEASQTGSRDLALLPRSGSASPPKSPPRTTQSPGSPQSDNQSHRLGHQGQHTPAYHHQSSSSSSSPPSKSKMELSQLTHLEASLQYEDGRKRPRTPWWKTPGGKPPGNYGRAAGRKMATPAHEESASASKARGGHLGHLAAAGLKPGGSKSAQFTETTAPVRNRKERKPMRPSGTGPRYERDKLYRERKKIRQELAQLIEKPGSGPEASKKSSRTPDDRPPGAKSEEKPVPWWKKEGGLPQRVAGSSPRYVKDRQYRERKRQSNKLVQELAHLLERPHEHHDHSPPHKGGGPGSPSAGGASQTVSK